MSPLHGMHDTSKPRVYCPSCGEVRGTPGYRRYQGGTGMVLRHTRQDGTKVPVLCPGGPITMEGDTAT